MRFFCVQEEELNDFKDGMTEDYVQVQLAINGYHTYYWESERGAEIDFAIQREARHYGKNYPPLRYMVQTSAHILKTREVLTTEA